MSSYFEEKSRQVDVDSMSAFGIGIVTRHAKARELAELLMFAEEAAKSNVHELVEEAFYDSNACCCYFKFKRPLEIGDPQEVLLLQAALKTIGQFEWFGVTQHGTDSKMA